MERGKKMIIENIALLSQAEELIKQLNDRLYSNNDNLPPFNCGVGMHVRHILDYYKAFLSIQDGVIDYDRRERSPELESSREAAVGAIQVVSEALQSIDDVDHAVTARNDDDPNHDHREGFKNSSIGRELKFLSSHTVHHFAMIAMILANQAYPPPEGFGVAASTLAYWRESRSK